MTTTTKITASALKAQMTEAPNEGALRELMTSPEFQHAIAEVTATEGKEAVDGLREFARQLVLDLRNGINLPWRNLRDFKNTRITVLSLSAPFMSSERKYNRDPEAEVEYEPVEKLVGRAREHGVGEFKFSVTRKQRVYRDLMGVARVIAQQGKLDVIFRKGEAQSDPYELEVPDMRRAPAEVEVGF